MSAEKPKHDYHLVDPSPWPIYVSFATLVLAFGAVYYFHSKALWLLLIGFALVVYGAFTVSYTHLTLPTKLTV